MQEQIGEARASPSLTTRISALTVTLVLVIRKAISLIVSIILGLMHVGRTIRGFVSLASAKNCSVLGLDKSTLCQWKLFGLDLDAMVRSLGVPSSLGGFRGEQPQEVDMQLMWTGAALVLFGDIGYTIESRPCEGGEGKIKVCSEFLHCCA